MKACVYIPFLPCVQGLAYGSTIPTQVSTGMERGRGFPRGKSLIFISCIVLGSYFFYNRGWNVYKMNDKVLTTRGLVLPHSGLYHVGLDGTAHAKLVIICDGAASSALLVQIGVG